MDIIDVMHLVIKVCLLFILLVVIGMFIGVVLDLVDVFFYYYTYELESGEVVTCKKAYDGGWKSGSSIRHCLNGVEYFEQVNYKLINRSFYDEVKNGL